LDEGADHRLRIKGRKRKRPNAPGTSQRKHFERVTQKRKREYFGWSPGEPSGQTRNKQTMQQ
jgi:hypothetical protein